MLHNSKFKNLVDNSAELSEAASRKLLSDQCFCICTRNQGKRRHVSAWKFEIPLRKRNVPTRYSGIKHKTRQECAVLHGEKSGNFRKPFFLVGLNSICAEHLLFRGNRPNCMSFLTARQSLRGRVPGACLRWRKGTRCACIRGSMKLSSTVGQ